MRGRQIPALLIALFSLCAAGFAQNESVVYNFPSFQQGEDLLSGVVMDKAGNLFGATYGGGNQQQCSGFGCGFAYELKRLPDGTWEKIVLHRFTGGKDGGSPVGTFAMDADGNLYGVTEQGGTSGSNCSSVLGFGCGVVYKLTRLPKDKWKFSVIYNFDTNAFSSDVNYPGAGVIFDRVGNLYGTTEFGGSFVCDCGIVYQLVNQSGTWTENILYTFEGLSQGGGDVSFPEGIVAIDSKGNIFGTASGGGDASCNDGCGGVFELISQKNGYKEIVLHAFHGGKDGFQPAAGVTLDAKGNFYGVTQFGGGHTGCNSGTFGCGTVYKMEKKTAGFAETVVYDFNGSNGYAPGAELVFDKSGNLYGTTGGGGASGNGTVFRLSLAGGKWSETMLFSFDGADGNGPAAILTSDGNGGYYGTTQGGGSSGLGVVFSLQP
jgi:uncharacterized repeat protein (TIGR03803 family)